MKRIFTRLACYALFCLPFFSTAQTINPGTSTIQCPEQTITFNVTLPVGTGWQLVSIVGTAPVPPTVFSQSGVSYFGNQMSFSFTGKFVDNNTPQNFRVTVSNGSTQNTYDFNYTMIRSFHDIYNVSRILSISPGSITAPLCQVSAYNISFPAVKFAMNPSGTVVEPVSQYQYLLPSGWSLGGTVSNGVTWITATNSVTVTSDASTGDGGSVQVRPYNACGAALIQGQVVQIPVSRPAAALTLTTTSATDFCIGTTRTYTIGGMPSGATVLSWTTSDPGIATVPANSTGTSVVVTGTGSGEFTLTATVSQCGAITPVSLNISAGTPVPNVNVNNDNCPFVVANTDIVAPDNAWTWYKDGTVQTAHRRVLVFQNLPGSHYLCAVYTNACGSSAQGCAWSICSTGGFLVASPNPGNGVFTISVNPSAQTQTAKTANAAATARFFRIRVTDQSGNIKKEFSYSTGVSRTTVDLSSLPNGTYILQTFDNKTWNSTQIVIAR